MTDSAEKLLLERARDFIIAGSCPLPWENPFHAKWHEERASLTREIDAHLSAHPVTGEGDANGGWLPIESAPRDGLVLVTIAPTPINQSMRRDYRSVYPAYINELGEICDPTTSRPDSYLNGQYYRSIAWMPLPAPMTAASGMDEGE